MADVDNFLKRLGGYVPPTTNEEYATEDSSIRNYLANKINPVLDNTVNKVIPEDFGRANVPVLSVGEQKDQDREMLKPENLALSMSGGIKTPSSMKLMPGMERKFAGGEAVSAMIRKDADELKKATVGSPQYEALRQRIKDMITVNSSYSKKPTP